MSNNLAILEKTWDAKEFFIDEFLTGGIKVPTNEPQPDTKLTEHRRFPASEEAAMKQFRKVCTGVKIKLEQDYTQLSESEKTAETNMQKRAIIGDNIAVKNLTDKIKDAIVKLNLTAERFPDYYLSLEGALFSELYGHAGLDPWINDYTEEYARSSSAKLIGENLYCLIDGKSVLQPQKISSVRRDQLRRALLMASPRERLDTGHNEVYVQREDGNHIRATIMSGGFTFPDQDVMVFRKYLLADPEKLTFETLASYGTFPEKCCKMFEALVDVGPNIFFCGEVRSGKSTFLQTWQHYEDPTLEGTTVSSDQETDYSKITKGPLVQIIADEKMLEQTEKSLKRLDSNYIIMSEVRTAADYKFYLGITNMGTRRCKCTIHDNNAVNFPYKMATEIVTNYGGDQQSTISQLYSNIDYVFELYEVPTDRSKKRLKGIVELRYDPVNDVCSAHRLCKYDARTDSWKWKCDIGQDKFDLVMGKEDTLQKVVDILKELEAESPLEDETVVYPAYYRGNQKMERGDC
ncbi:MAG: hypothetical protein IJP00_01350 [Firmicutes bacterium]|nr:hypothetical protein [Bacillota bacterium]